MTAIARSPRQPQESGRAARVGAIVWECAAEMAVGWFVPARIHPSPGTRTRRRHERAAMALPGEDERRHRQDTSLASAGSGHHRETPGKNETCPVSLEPSMGWRGRPAMIDGPRVSTPPVRRRSRATRWSRLLVRHRSSVHWRRARRIQRGTRHRRGVAPSSRRDRGPRR